MQRLLVTGGAGFIGSHFIRYMLEHRSDLQITNLDSLTYAGNRANLADVAEHPRYRFLHGNITCKETVQILFDHEPPDIVVNFAAETHVDRSIASAEAFIRTNVLGTQTLLDVCRRYGVQKFIQISTDEVYGSLGADGLFTEASPLDPSSPYSATKAAADLLVMAFARTYGLPVNITRCSNNYGPYQYPEKLIPAMIIGALRDQPLPIYGDGQNVRDWLHVHDHCEAVALVLEHGAPGEIYNIGGNNEATNLDVVRRILARLGKPESYISFVPDRPGHDRRYAIDASKIKRDLGWTPRHPFTEGLDQTIDWYVQNDAWWQQCARHTIR